MSTTSTTSIRVLLIDDHTVMRVALRRLIECQPGLTVVGEAANRTAALQIAACEQPDIILLDLDLGDESGLDILPELLAAANRARVIVLTGIHDSEEYHRAVRLGAMGLVLKEQAVDVLMKAIKKVYIGEAWLEPSMVARLLTEMARQRAVGKKQIDSETAKISSLTPREREIIGCVGEGLRNKQIALRLSISEVTVSHHFTSIFAKLDLANRFDLVVYAYRHGLAQPPR